jgi:2-dehydropantoate 2-reductase
MRAIGFDSKVVDKAREVAIKTNNKSSMVQDIESKRTEIDFITGAIVRKGNELGIDTTINRIMLDLIKGVEACTG